jgi:hypothetical protein
MPIFTEVIGYKQPIKLIVSEDQEVEEYIRGNESDDSEETYGVEGMTLQLIELLTTLVSRPNVQEVVKQGIIPLISSITCFMIV